MHYSSVCIQKLMHVTFSFVFPSRCAKTRTSNFRKVVRQHTEGMVGMYYMDFVGNLPLFPAVKEFWKYIKNWQSYRHEFGVLLFWGHSVELFLLASAALLRQQ